MNEVAYHHIPGRPPILMIPGGKSRPTLVPAAPALAPSLLTKASRLRRELTAWLAAGAPIASREIRHQRLTLCRACPHYNPAGNLGLGECRAPGCGCTRIKLALATSQCPLKPPKWSAL